MLYVAQKKKQDMLVNNNRSSWYIRTSDFLLLVRNKRKKIYAWPMDWPMMLVRPNQFHSVRSMAMSAMVVEGE